MARTPLMENVQRAVAEIAHEDEGARTTRAKLLKQAGLAGLGVAGLARLGTPARAATSPAVVVVGAGLAGLTCAYRLKQAATGRGLRGFDRLGGRCWSNRGFFADGQVFEHGGELIDQGHTQLRSSPRSSG